MQGDSIQVLAISTAQAQNFTVGQRTLRTGHFKQPQAGAVDIGTEGIAGDFIGNPKHHGGPDQALYLYSQADADWWANELDRTALPAGFFGENLTIDDWWPAVRVGDRLQCGDLLLEITGPRIPCATLAARVGDAGFAKSFVKAERPGAYVRVLQSGEIKAGDSLQVQPASEAFPTVVELYRFWHTRRQDASFVQRTLAAPVASRMRAELEELAARQAKETQPLPGI
ncbi:MOSC domain-containing protein [Halopseudomonas salegens]|uniref:MOSC domain-containing protein YiiM n=1 Tax=Halopseudomonas salegens TaxID=1434072 RepID=A0A1H2I3X9_9GAMM|nr:MOSC domain-containing protein [Halopseudomonas salegens]SDU38665.1 MOSC domain-containing protein YiiM [Halopseudomonas salegens]